MKNFLATILIFLGSILHAEENPLGITLFGSFLHTDRVPNALFFFSDIQKDDSFELRRALRTHEIDTIVLASPGGSVWESLTMASMIFYNKMTTYVPPLPKGDGCYSACAYMFFAGQTRLAVGELGVHQIGAYGSGVDSEKRKVGETQQATQFTTSEVIGHLNDFKTPPWVYERMFRSRAIYAFTEDEKRKLSQGLLDPSLRSSIDVFLGQLRAALKKAEKIEQKVIKTEPKNPVADGLDTSNKDKVKAIQNFLNAAGCSAGLADGVWRQQTNDAAKRFALANGLKYFGSTSITASFIKLLTGKIHKECQQTYQSSPNNIPSKISPKSRPTSKESTTGGSPIKPRPQTRQGLDTKNRDKVKAIQKFLNTAGCFDYFGRVDGIWGNQTNNAARKFAAINGINYSGPSSIDDNFIKLLTRKNHKSCSKSNSPSSNSLSPLHSPQKNTSSRPMKLHLHWRFECKGGAGAMAVPIFGRVQSYNSSTGAVVFIIKDRDGLEGTAQAVIANGYITMWGKPALMEKNFTYFKILNDKSCPNGFVGTALK